MTSKSFFILTIFLIVGFFSVNFTHDAYACSCIEITDLQALEKSSASFVGTPVKIESQSGFNNIVTFHIERPIKNIAENITEIIIITSTQESACGYNFESNTRYLVNTYDEKNQKTLETGLCSGNKNLGFSSIPLLVNESVLKNYPESVFLYQVFSYLIIAGIISGIVIGIIIYNKKKKLKTK